MTLLERVSYIRGLMDGLNLDEKEPITRVVTEMVDVLDEMAATIILTDYLQSRSFSLL